MPSGKVTVTGLEKTLANIQKWGVEKRKAVEDATKESALRIEAQAKRGCPVWTGRLRASMSSNWAGSGLMRGKVGFQAGSADGVGEPGGPKGLVAVVGSNVSYAHMQEYGSWGDAPKPSGERMSIPKRDHEPMPRPEGGFQMLTKAYLQNEQAYLKKVEDALKKD